MFLQGVQDRNGMEGGKNHFSRSVVIDIVLTQVRCVLCVCVYMCFKRVWDECLCIDAGLGEFEPDAGLGELKSE